MDDQNIKKDEGKTKLSLCFPEIIEACAKVREFGLTKYPPETWKDVDNQRYEDALLRHMYAYLEDNNAVDPESKLNHLAHVAWNVSALLAKNSPKNSPKKLKYSVEESAYTKIFNRGYILQLIRSLDEYLELEKHLFIGKIDIKTNKITICSKLSGITRVIDASWLTSFCEEFVDFIDLCESYPGSFKIEYLPQFTLNIKTSGGF